MVNAGPTTQGLPKKVQWSRLSPPVGDNDRVWSSRFYREFNDWDLAASYSLLHFIQTWFPKGGGSDKLCWRLNGSGKFDVRSFYHKIRNVTLSTFPWKVKGPKRVAFFTWTTTHGQILTLDNLMLRGSTLANQIGRASCRERVC